MTEKDLGVLVGTKLNTSHKYALNAKKANSILGCIRLSVTSRTRGIIHPVYIALAAPGVLCLILGPTYKRDMATSARVQQKAT